MAGAYFLIFIFTEMETTTLQNKFDLLKKHFGYEKFLPNQEEIINNILDKKDTIAIMPTGGGKSLCFQLPALALEGTAIVISPLIALMKDQVDALKANGISATFFNSSQPYEEQQQVLKNLNELLKEKFKQSDLITSLYNYQVHFDHAKIREFKLDEKGTPLGLVIKERKDIHKLIEEFMLLANKTVAEFIYNKNKGKDTFVYRIHDHPDLDRLATFANFAKKFGHEITIDEDTNVSRTLNDLMDDIVGKPEQNVLEQLAIRSMAKAKYTTVPKGHFGLAFVHYTHFTSPIRRYPDMMVHRLLQHYLDGGKSPEAEAWEEKFLYSSEREKRAADSERASIKYKQVEYMALAEKKDYDGIVTGVTEWGVFVEITETTVKYLKDRISKGIEFQFKAEKEEIRIPLNVALYSWVVENLVKNAADAMQNKGALSIYISDTRDLVTISVADTGSGIPKRLYKRIFEPGFTTKTRGWGLGLSLAKRIIEDYHKGKIFVAKSDKESGTEIQIVLKK